MAVTYVFIVTLRDKPQAVFSTRKAAEDCVARNVTPNTPDELWDILQFVNRNE